jgi:CTP synthase
MDSSDLLASVSDTSDETEFYTPIPDGYVKGRVKYVVVFGTVMSGLGKGIFSSSLARLLSGKGLRVTPIKLEGYLNVDSGTLNPFRHGEVFVLDDGMETDMDLGTYERMLDQDLTRDNFTTSGQIYTSVLDRERKGGYLGRDVQMIPHVTAEVKLRLRRLAMTSRADVVFIEIGGTAGDFENGFYIEAMRQLAYEEGAENVLFVALTFILEPPTLGEQKSKAAQLGIKQLLQMGIQPHMIGCRAQKEVTEKVREKISVYTNVPKARVFSMHDCESIYLIPSRLRDAQIDQQVLHLLDLTDRVKPTEERRHWKSWKTFVDRILSPEGEISVGITGKYVSVRDSYASLLMALEHAGAYHRVRVRPKWIDTSLITPDNVAKAIEGVDAIIVPGGFGTRGTEGKIACIQYARENDLPYLGLCYGFQMAVIEFARNALGLAGANSTEIDPDCSSAVIDILPEQKEIEGLGGNMRLGGRDVEVRPDTLASRLFGGATRVRLRFRHRYEVDPKYIEQIEASGMVFSGKAPDYEIMQILELPGHRYFVGTQSHPEMTSRPLTPSPFFVGLVAAALGRDVGAVKPLTALA